MTEITKDEQKELKPSTHHQEDIVIPENLRSLIREARERGVDEEVLNGIEKKATREIRTREATKETIYGFEAMVEELIDRKKMDVKESEQDEMLSRRLRDVEMTDLINKAENGEEITEAERNTLQAVLNRRGLAKTIQNIQNGDTVITVLSPVSEALAIKNLNDKVFGQQVTDKIILKSRLILERAFMKKVREAGLSEAKASELVLDQNYKTGVFKVPSFEGFDAKSMMNEVCEELDIKMKIFLNDLIEKEKNNPKNIERKKAYEDLRVNVNAEGYRTTFGAAKAESADEISVEDKVLVLERSLQTSRERSLDDGTEGYGGEYSEEEIMAKVRELTEVAKELEKNNNEFQFFDENGEERSVELFAKSANLLVLDRNLLRSIRKKDKILPVPGNEVVFDKLKKYVAGLNLFDLVKPFTAEEFGEIEKTAAKEKGLVEAVKNNDKAAIKEVAKILEKEVRDERFTSEGVFHSEASKIKDCAYLSLDVLDVGVDQLLDYEQMIQKVVNGKMPLRDAQKKAGDSMTEKLREMREKVFDLLSKNGLVEKERALGLVGGDELVVAVDLQKISEADLEKLIFDIKTSTNSRVVKTVMSEVKRHTRSAEGKDAGKIQMEKHLEALKKAETGTKAAKEIETKLRVLGLRAKAVMPPGDEYENVKDFIDSMKSFIMLESDDDFLVKVGSDTGPKRPTEVIGEIQSYLDKVKQYE